MSILIIEHSTDTSPIFYLSIHPSVRLFYQVLAFDNSELEAASDRFEATQKLWGTIKLWGEKKSTWMESKFRGLEVDLVAKEIEEYAKIR